MQEELIFTKNPKKYDIKRFLIDKKYVYTCTSGKLNLRELRKIISFIQTIEPRYSFLPLPVFFNMYEVVADDKLAYIIFEYICYYLIKIKKYKCYVNIGFKTGINTHNANASPLLVFRERKIATKDVLDEYVKRFEKQITITHYRRIIGVRDHGTEVTSKINTEIQIFLDHLSIEKKYASDVNEVIGELIDNSGEHGCSDCLVDIDVSPPYTKKNSKGLYYGVNIVILNFSQKLLGEEIEKVLKSESEFNEWYLKLRTAWENHSKLWDATYTEKDFFIMAAFQHRITSRSGKSETGGTGLTKLILALEKQSDAYSCFVHVGNRKLCLEHNCLETDDEGWVGFNMEKDFVNHRPKNGILKLTDVFFPGTAYNLNFVLKKDDENEK